MHFQAFLLDGLVRWNEDRAQAAVEGKNRQPLLCYSGHLQHILNLSSQRVLGKEQVKDDSKPSEYTGELLGVEYLYSQTGRVLQDVSADPDLPEEAVAVEQLDEEDEGFQEEDVDPTVHIPHVPPLSGPSSSSAAPLSGEPADAPRSGPTSPTAPEDGTSPEAPEDGTSPEAPEDGTSPEAPEDGTSPEAPEDGTSPEAPEDGTSPEAPEDGTSPEAPGRHGSPHPDHSSDSEGETKGPDNLPGYQHVCRLARGLVGVRNRQGLSDRRVDGLVALWLALPDLDKPRLIYPARHQERIVQGRFKATKGKSSIVLGKDSASPLSPSLQPSPSVQPSPAPPCSPTPPCSPAPPCSQAPPSTTSGRESRHSSLSLRRPHQSHARPPSKEGPPTRPFCQPTWSNNPPHFPAPPKPCKPKDHRRAPLYLLRCQGQRLGGGRGWRRTKRRGHLGREGNASSTSAPNVGCRSDGRRGTAASAAWGSALLLRGVRPWPSGWRK
ncbi:SH3 and multiple ankyrin repeat domains protein 1 [Oncorhynchus mykiss]|uniref:SH3 and multiple ankyrin repeat domains protein 1 n=1 Tax=Oncorhynchus mykiss TaxID=8022 RepID=UPI001878F853|nr:SH3 and multiple ankyrin repeat domains protein 1 [Oncorhynchus mykiss]